MSLQTGSGSSLVRTNLAWAAPASLSHPAIIFTFGFATDEIFAAGEFFDSFSITVRNADRSFVAPVLTADVLGLTLAPANPDGAQFAQEDIQPEGLSFPSSGLPQGPHGSQQGFLVLVVLPPALAGQSGTLGLSLFDNLNGQRSVAFINQLAVVPGPGSPIFVESSASAAGPYAVEDGLLIRYARRCINLPRPGANRFYRLRSPAQSRIALMRPEGANWAFDYTGGQTGLAPTLQSSAQVIGPYAIENGVIADTAARTLRVRQEGTARFFRIRSEIPLRIRHLTMDPRQMILQYE